MSWVLLALAVVASAVVVGIAALVVYLAVEGYSGNGVQPLAFPVALILFIVAEIPAVLICVLLWLGYRVASERRADASGWRRKAGELAG